MRMEEGKEMGDEGVRGRRGRDRERKGMRRERGGEEEEEGNEDEKGDTDEPAIPHRYRHSTFLYAYFDCRQDRHHSSHIQHRNIPYVSVNLSPS